MSAARARRGNITIWIAGDSTVANGSTPCPIGWGAQFMPHFNSKVTVSNRAIGGRSVQTWLYDVSSTLGTDGECVLNSTTYQAAWTAMLTGMKAGDYLFIQFGINDTDSTCPRHVGTALFKTDYGMMAQAAKDRGANPIFVTPVSSIACSGSKATPTRGTFATATIQAGTQYNVPVIDLEQLSVALYTSLGFCPLPGAGHGDDLRIGRDRRLLLRRPHPLRASRRRSDRRPRRQGAGRPRHRSRRLSEVNGSRRRAEARRAAQPARGSST